MHNKKKIELTIIKNYSLLMMKLPYISKPALFISSVYALGAVLIFTPLSLRKNVYFGVIIVTIISYIFDFALIFFGDKIYSTHKEIMEQKSGINAKKEVAIFTFLLGMLRSLFIFPKLGLSVIHDGFNSHYFTKFGLIVLIVPDLIFASIFFIISMICALLILFDMGYKYYSLQEHSDDCNIDNCEV